MNTDRSGLRPFLTVEQLADRWQVSERTVRRMIERGELRALRVGPQLRVPLEVLDRYEMRRMTDLDRSKPGPR
jgi:excisionase family DNA binding protein